MTPYYDHAGIRVYQGDALAVLQALPSDHVQCIVTSPPYWGLRDYGVEGQIGLEATPTEYVDTLVAVLREARRVLRPDGTLWLNLGDRFEDKELVGIPWMVAFALRADGWLLRSECIWEKTNCMPDSTEDRPTRSHEQVFLMTRGQWYYYDGLAIKEPHTREPFGGKNEGYAPGTKSGQIRGHNQDRIKAGAGRLGNPPSGRNKRSVWAIPTRAYKGVHFAVMPERLVEPCLLAGSRPGDTVLDPFAGAGTTLAVAKRLGRHAIGVELKQAYIEEHIIPRLAQDVLPLTAG